ncbi:FG-GAP-like repeat-containing protein [Streptomyces sp. NPDC006656]|uniref:FG-GAP-like repeat-containing protein n=1 Tax=Streptomyces sp. NPDC006656 TaxID=3156899 RepID=UPI0034521BE1
MMKRLTSFGSFTLAVLTTAAALALGAAPATAAPQPAPPLLKIMPLGDSITQGAHSSHESGYRTTLWNQLAKQARYTPDFVGSVSSGQVGDPDHEGHSGWTVGQVDSKIDGWLAAAEPDVVLVQLGINDLNQHFGDGPTTAHKLSRLIDRIQADRPGVTTIVQGLLPDTTGYEDQVSAFNTIIQAEEASRRASGQHFTYVVPPRLSVPTEMPDGLHPNDQGYPKMASAFQNGIEQAVTDGWTVRRPATRAGTEAGGSGRDRWADFDGDGRPDHVTVEDNGAVNVQLNQATPAGGLWKALGQVATGLTRDRARVRFSDFDGDGKADYILVNPDGSVNVWLNRGGDSGAGWQGIGRAAGGTTTNQEQVRFADWDGDGRTDYLTIADKGAVNVWLNRGGDSSTNGWVPLDQVAGGTTTDRSRVRLADFDGDGRADYWTISPNGSLQTYLNRGGDRHGGWQALGQTAGGVTADHNRVHLVDYNADTHADYLLTGSRSSFSAYLFNGGDTTGPNGWTYIGDIIDSN